MKRMRPLFGNRSRGQVMVEYLIVVGLLAFALMLPVDGTTLLDQLVTALQTLFRRFSVAISLPV